MEYFHIPSYLFATKYDAKITCQIKQTKIKITKGIKHYCAKKKHDNKCTDHKGLNLYNVLDYINDWAT